MLPLAATLLPYVLYTRGLESVSNGKASVLAFAEPLTACVLGVAVLGQAMTAEMGCGVALVFAALVGLVGAREEKSEKNRREGEK
jgi:drug/metabolite transporter (DMT)-like permease